jgi:cysteine-rich repeat protein
MREKRGQFFLIAAVVIIVVTVSIVTISNYTQKKDTVKLYDLGQELGIESQSVLDYGTYSELNETQMKALMENFIQNYVDYIGETGNLYFVFGNMNKINVIGYQQLANESVCVKINPIVPWCGDGKVNQVSEECDDGNTNNGDGCSSACNLESPQNCNHNNDKGGGEVCDGTDLEGKTCVTLGFLEPEEVPGTALTCEDCKFDVSGCVREEAECMPLEIMGETQEFVAQTGEITRVAIQVAENEYQFALRPGENFYFVIWQKIGGEKHVITSDT